jgi:hypothetical protein
MQHFLGSKIFPFLPYKIGARLLSRTRMVQYLLLVSHIKQTLLKGPIHAIIFLNRTKFPAALADMNINVLTLKILKKFL